MIVQNKDIIIVGLQPWDNDIGSNCKNIALEFSKHNRVLYVNYALDRITAKREKTNPAFKTRFEIIKNKSENLFQVNDNLWNLFPVQTLESANWLPFTFLFRIVNRWNNKRFAKDIKRAIKRLKFKDYILFNDSDMFRSFYLKELLQPALTIYYTRDNLMGVPYWFKHGRKIEPELFAKSDLVVANSTYLANIAGKYNSNSFYVGQGCDIEDFNRQRISYIPEDIFSIKKPVIGYIGALYNLRLDLNLLEELVNEKPEWNFVFIGPEDNSFKNSLLHRKNNVHFLGLKEAKELPAYLNAFDVALNPQRINEVTIGNYPRKIDEYLAMGKPVVATKTGAMDIFAEYVYFASTAQEYKLQIQKALRENNEELEKLRIDFAKQHTWENSVAEIYKAILSVHPGYENTTRHKELINN
ncbi:MAG TPA: glycosyltransferase [Flavisolibacter sp.]|nr:glycosyltransferase [Flavisolibacter sp.]